MIEIETNSELLSAVFNKLQTNGQPGCLNGARSAHLEVARNGWGLRHDCQDLMWETDDRADSLERHHHAFDCLLEPFQLAWMSRYRRPTSKAKEAFGSKAMRAEDIAAWLIAIERLGFSVDPKLLVDELRPKIAKQDFISNSELSILWYTRNRHRQEPILLKCAGQPNSQQSFKTATDYLVTVLFEGDKPVILRVDAPKSRTKSMLKYWSAVQLHQTSVYPSPQA